MLLVFQRELDQPLMGIRRGPYAVVRASATAVAAPAVKVAVG
jgi:hypothetical protein